MPPHNQAAYRNDIWAICAPLLPMNRLRAIVHHRNALLEKKKRDIEKQLAEHSTPSDP